MGWVFQSPHSPSLPATAPDLSVSSSYRSAGQTYSTLSHVYLHCIRPSLPSWSLSYPQTSDHPFTSLTISRRAVLVGTYTLAGARVIFKAFRILQGWLYIHARAKIKVYTHMCILKIKNETKIQVCTYDACIYDAHYTRWDGLLRWVCTPH